MSKFTRHQTFWQKFNNKYPYIDNPQISDEIVDKFLSDTDWDYNIALDRAYDYVLANQLHDGIME